MCIAVSGRRASTASTRSCNHPDHPQQTERKMSATDDNGTGTSGFEITRLFNAPRGRVWEAWSESNQLKHWWGPDGCVIEIPRFECRRGGFFHYVMKFADAPAMWGRFNYRQIARPDRIVWLNSFSNE